MSIPHSSETLKQVVPSGREADIEGQKNRTKNSLADLFLGKGEQSSFLGKLLRSALVSLFGKGDVEKVYGKAERDGNNYYSTRGQESDNSVANESVNVGVSMNTSEKIGYDSETSSENVNSDSGYKYAINNIGTWPDNNAVALSALSALAAIEKNEGRYDLVGRDAKSDISFGRYQFNTYGELPAFLKFIEENSSGEKLELAKELNGKITKSVEKNGSSRVDVFAGNDLLMTKLRRLAVLTKHDQVEYKTSIILETVRDIRPNLKDRISQHPQLKEILTFILDTQNWRPVTLEDAYDYAVNNPSIDIFDALIEGRKRSVKELDKIYDPIEFGKKQYTRVQLHNIRGKKLFPEKFSTV